MVKFSINPGTGSKNVDIQLPVTKIQKLCLDQQIQ